MTRNAKVIVASSTKGGTTKTTIISNLGAYLAMHHKKVLFIDLDYQADLTSCMNQVPKDALDKSKVMRAYYHDAKNVRSPFPSDFKPAKVNKYVDLMAGSRDMNKVSNVMRNHTAFAYYVLLHVFESLHLAENYDYILIDCHNSFNLLTDGAMVVADKILTPIIPGRFSIKSVKTMIESMKDLKANLINPATRQPFITASLYFVGNLLDANTKSSKQLKQIIKTNKIFIASFKRRELVNRAMTNFHSVFTQAEIEGSRSKAIAKNEIEPEFAKIAKVINKK